ncbi:MAG: tetratricopeptide repeat protein [Leptolyngbya sp.]|nr:tetratricopeptide repeat protein [Candidatus Melainabacteria bacterium]
MTSCLSTLPTSAAEGPQVIPPNSRITPSRNLVAATAEEHAKVWQQLQANGTDYLESNLYGIAEPFLVQAVAEARKFPEGDARLSKSLSELGRLYTIRGRYAEAEPVLEDELRVKEIRIGNDDGKIIPSIGSLVRFYLNHGTAQKAEPLTREILSFVEGTLQAASTGASGKVKLEKGAPLQGWAGAAAPVMHTPLIEWAITCDELANIYKTREEWETAERLYKAALDVKSTVLGKNHLSLANSYDSLGSLCLARNEDEDAISYFKDALAITEKILPPENPQVYARLDKLAKVLIKQNRHKDAEELYSLAQTLYKAEPSKNGNEARALYALGSVYCDEKDYVTAAPILEKALVAAELFHGPSSIMLVPYLQKYAYALYYVGDKPTVASLRARADSISGVM